MGHYRLSSFVRQHPRLFVLTGAGVSIASGIPGYRDAEGQWTRPAPVHLREFVGSENARRRYWLRCMAGYPAIEGAIPNPAHHALALLEELGYCSGLVTQNVDSLHQRAGSRRVIDLHGTLATVTCRACGLTEPRSALQRRLEAGNPESISLTGVRSADGDAEVERECAGFHVPGCRQCDGVLKPDVVFFGEGVPAARVARARGSLLAADAMLVVGSSLMVWSGYRFCEWAYAAAKPIAAINPGRTRADHLLTLKIEERCETALPALVEALGSAWLTDTCRSEETRNPTRGADGATIA